MFLPVDSLKLLRKPLLSQKVTLPSIICNPGRIQTDKSSNIKNQSFEQCQLSNKNYFLSNIMKPDLKVSMEVQNVTKCTQATYLPESKCHKPKLNLAHVPIFSPESVFSYDIISTHEV